MEKRPKRVRVYGVDSTKDVRARLIDILMERAKYHKDKFIAPIIYEEMKSMEIKKSGKVEHSDKTHDDQVFSYLMALYVWYEGHNLVENFGIRKTTLHTDTDEEIDEADFEDAIEKKEKLDFRSAEFEADEELSNTLEWVENDAKNFKTSADLEAMQYLQKIQQRNSILSTTNNVINNSTDVMNQVVLSYQAGGNQFQSLPDSIYSTEDEMDLFSEYDDRPAQDPRLQGNLSHLYDIV